MRGNNFGEGLKEFHLPAHLKNTSGQLKIDAFMHQKWPVGKWKSIVKSIDALSVSLANGSIVGFSQSLQNTLATLKVLNSLSILSLPEKLAGKINVVRYILLTLVAQHPCMICIGRCHKFLEIFRNQYCR